MLYFTLWHYDLLPAALVVRILHSLLKRRFLPYPTAEDLRKRRQRAAETELLGNTMDQFSGSWSWLSLTPVLAAAGRDVPLADALKTIRYISKAKKAKLKSKAAEALSEATKDVPLEEQRKTQQQAKEDLRRREQEEDWKAAIVWFLEGLADVHERVRNVFLWRREEVSMRYAYVSVSWDGSLVGTELISHAGDWSYSRRYTGAPVVLARKTRIIRTRIRILGSHPTRPRYDTRRTRQVHQSLLLLVPALT